MIAQFLPRALILFVLGTSPAAACGWGGELLGVCDAVDVADENIRKLTEVVKQIGEATIRAVPGERYMQLIDDLNSGDKDKAAAARAFLSRLANVKEDTEFQAVVNIEFDTSKGDFEYEIYRQEIPGRETIEAIVEQRTLVSFVRAKSFGSYPRTTEQIRNDVKKYILTAMNKLNGEVSVNRIVAGQDAQGGRNYIIDQDPISDDRTVMMPFIPSEQFEQQKEKWRGDVLLQREAVSDDIVRAIMTLLESQDSVDQTVSRVIPWDVIQPKPFVFVVISEDTYNKNVDFKVQISVSEVKNEKKYTV